jgi:proline iminopeptidase
MTSDIHTIKEESIEVGQGHSVYTQLWGNPDAATTFVFLHGGPGSGCSDKHKALFDPAKHRVLFFDQRGSGKSQPYGSLEANTTDHLIDDITFLAKHYSIEKFTFVGGSWGSCLALAYTLKHPEPVNGLVLRGIFTGSQEEIDFLEQGHFKAFFPDVWARFLARTPKKHHDNPIAYHQSRLLGNNEIEIQESGLAYEELEGSLITLDERYKPINPETFDPSGIRIEVYYTANRCFMEDEHIFNNAHKITAPVWIVQGRYDTVCAPINAYKLHDTLPNSTLLWTLAGHYGNDRGNFDATKSIIATIGMTA